MNENQISVIDAANKLGMRKQSLFKIIKRLGVNTSKERNSSHKGQAITYITEADFDLIASQIHTQGKKDSEEPSTSSQIDRGVFYLIELEPAHDPGRFKVGFASNMPERLRQHRCSAPFAIVIATWPCHILWEKTAIACVTQKCEKLHTEVFRAKDIAGVKEKCDQFFSLMPALNEIMR
ncbi:MAG: hypothetical protein A4E70_01797 [Syntrophus sp. PtaU1.Bin005]|jgi:hypothetical protein|nr:MAG: hypothetical protein A4E70_01797 [Syntrophus sp. PtaU1.Bin005]